MNRTEIFFEGSPLLKLPLLTFILKAVPEAHGRVFIRLGKNKDETIKDFLRAASTHPKGRYILLVDSDEPDHGGLFKNLCKTALWRKHSSGTIASQDVHWMVQVMEAWFVADEAALRS